MRADTYAFACIAVVAACVAVVAGMFVMKGLCGISPLVMALLICAAGIFGFVKNLPKDKRDNKKAKKAKKSKKAKSKEIEEITE